MAGFKNKKRARPVDNEASDSDAEVAKAPQATKKAKTKTGELDSGKDAEGNSFWSLSAMRRITLSEFKGSQFVNIREYYEDSKSGTMRPGKKGISLSLEQYNTLLKSIPAINEELAGLGHSTASVASLAISEADSKHAPKPKKKDKPKPKKANIEATSDEEEEEEEAQDDDDEDTV